MMRGQRPTELIFAAAPVDRGAPAWLHRQVYQGVREAILSRRLATGVRLPSSRGLAATLGVSPHSVNSYFQRVNAKLGVLNRKEAAHLAAEYGLI